MHNSAPDTMISDDWNSASQFPGLALSVHWNIQSKQRIFWDTDENQAIIDRIVQNNCLFPESAWLSFIHLPLEKIEQTNFAYRDMLFSKALNCGNYTTLLNSLRDELCRVPKKERLFDYEMGTLYFFAGKQKNAFERYNQLVSYADTPEQKYKFLLKIVETTHGDASEQTVKNIDCFLNEMKSGALIYRLYSKYWQLHIASERGEFNLKEYTNLLNQLNGINDTNDDGIYLEIVKRCYTDIIRISHITYVRPNLEIIKNFKSFMKKNFSNSVYEYYDSLYICANTKHYLALLECILNGQDTISVCKKIQMYYDSALKTGYQNQKSKTACELKRIDFELFLPHNIYRFIEYEETINEFLINAQINKVDVHVGYCKTLLAKMYMIAHLDNEDTYLLESEEHQTTLQQIQDYLTDARDIYTRYNNDYGTIRTLFLEYIFDYFFKFNQKKSYKVLKEITGILEKHPEYQREKRILEELELYKADNHRMYYLALLKAYPIIMQ